jgi:hypothetical protein
MMPNSRLDRFLSANRELRNFLQRVNGLVHGTGDVGPAELRALGGLLDAMAPEIADSSTAVSADAVLQAQFQEQFQEYVGNLRAVQESLEHVRCVMFARLTQIDAARQHMNGLQGWANAYRQTA